jgi:predicted RNase H-like nuclease
MTVFVGVDLGWYGKPTGLAAIHDARPVLEQHAIARLETMTEILDWISGQVGTDDAVIGVDAPLVIPNATGIREGERHLNAEYRRYDAGCHPANLSRPFAAHVLAFSRALGELGFPHGTDMSPRQPGRFQIEVHPHSATVALFALPQIVKYKRGARADRARGLGRLRRLMVERLPALDPSFVPDLPHVPRSGNLKPVEDQIDAVLCAYIAAHWWHWGRERNVVYGSNREGYIVVPKRGGYSPPSCL